MNEDKATRYHRLKRRVSVASVALSVLLLVALIVLGWSIGLRTFAERLASPAVRWPVIDAIASRSIYLVLVGLLNEAVGLPLGFYGGYLIEHRYGLSTETVGHWLRDQAKGFAVGGLFAMIGFNLLYAALDLWPHAWWLAAGAGFAVVTILIANIFPVLLLPIFYKVVPITRDSLRHRLVALAGRAGVRVVDTYELRMSDRTRKANAALAGLGRTRRILVSDTLLAEYSDDEIETILAHELGHFVHRDIWKGIAFEALLSLAGFYLAARLLVALSPWARLRAPNDIAGLPVLLISAAAVSLVLVPVANALSRRHERRADDYALDLSGNPAAFISAMRRLAAQNLAEEQPSRLARILFYTHPPVLERIEAARHRLS